jgi:type IV fimbrial biogenesis protein FimT
MQTGKTAHRGFTLLELMLTITIAAVILGLGIPNMVQFIRNGRLTSAANDLLASVYMARTEAIKRRLPTRICFSADPTAALPVCDGTGMQGWVSWVDTNNDGDADAGEAIIARHGALPATLTLKSKPNGNAGYVAYRASGFSPPAADDLTGIVLCDLRGNQALYGGTDISAARGVLISATGRPRVTRSRAEISANTELLNGGACP